MREWSTRVLLPGQTAVISFYLTSPVGSAHSWGFEDSSRVLVWQSKAAFSLGCWRTSHDALSFHLLICLHALRPVLLVTVTQSPRSPVDVVLCGFLTVAVFNIFPTRYECVHEERCNRYIQTVPHSLAVNVIEPSGLNSIELQIKNWLIYHSWPLLFIIGFRFKKWCDDGTTGIAVKGESGLSTNWKVSGLIPSFSSQMSVYNWVSERMRMR